jgi:folate-binding Fe-S cluster repair protein YgfZ
MVQVFVDRTGRIIDLARCIVQGNSVLVIVSPSMTSVVRDRLEKYILWGDNVRL